MLFPTVPLSVDKANLSTRESGLTQNYHYSTAVKRGARTSDYQLPPVAKIMLPKSLDSDSARKRVSRSHPTPCANHSRSPFLSKCSANATPIDPWRLFRSQRGSYQTTAIPVNSTEVWLHNCRHDGSKSGLILKQDKHFPLFLADMQINAQHSG